MSSFSGGDSHAGQKLGTTKIKTSVNKNLKSDSEWNTVSKNHKSKENPCPVSPILQQIMLNRSSLITQQPSFIYNGHLSPNDKGLARMVINSSID